MSSIFNDPEWEQQRKEILSDWARRDGEVKVDMGETEEYMPAEEFLALRQKYPNGNMRLSEPQEAMKVFKDKGLPLPAELSFAGSVKPIFGQEDAYNGSTSFPAEAFNFPASANEGYQSGLGFSPVVSAMQMPERESIQNIKLKTKDEIEPIRKNNIVDNLSLLYLNSLDTAEHILDYKPDFMKKYETKLSNDELRNKNLIKRFFYEWAESFEKTPVRMFLPPLLKSGTALTSILQMAHDYFKYKDKKMNDKRKHFIMSCNSAKIDPQAALALGYLKEINDRFSGQSSIENHLDLDADRLGRLWAVEHPDQTCEAGADIYYPNK